ncbi:MAG: hypothetical protein IJV00_10360 [Clostridia bacterium]|nr:hypothetical protein [Clostridia bacterium]
MYKVSVPLVLGVLDRSKREDVLKTLRDFDAERVFLAISAYTTDKKAYEETMEKLKTETEYFKSRGFEVGCWLWTFMLKDNPGFIPMTFPDGTTDPEEICPSDENFIKFAADYAAGIAKTGVDMIMYDDDYRYGFISSNTACTCKNHRAYMEKLLNKPIPENLKDCLFAGGKNEVRSAWIKAKGHFFREFARKMREAVDKVDPTVRFGVCSCMSLWDQDGVSTDEISRILAGNTKPFMRLIGAPYWAARRSSLGSRLQYVIETERAELSWVEKPEEIEIFSEGDAYPRPRYATPASYVEGFDTALRADGRINGILKYGIEYCGTVKYETGYAESHVENRPAYRAIDEMFSKKTCVGVRIRRPRDVFEDCEVPQKVSGSPDSQFLFYSDSAKLFSTLSVPTVYSGKGVTNAAFGEEARNLSPDAFEGGLILDAAAAKILTEKGVDVGVRESGERFAAGEEYYPDYKEYGACGGKATKIKPDKGAIVLSTYSNGSPAAYLYENKAAQRFMVLCFEAFRCDESMWRQYTKGRQIADAVPWLSGEKLPAFSYGNPDLYIMAKEGGGKLAVGLWNFHPDAVKRPVIELKKEYKNAKFFNCTGTLEGDRLSLSRLEAFGFCFAELSV